MPTMEKNRLIQRQRLAIQEGWYGGRPRVSPHGRRAYSTYGRVRHLTMHQEPRPAPPGHDEGRAYLRRVLREWRTTYAALSAADDADGGPTRRAIVAAGLALADPGVDGQERADVYVTMVAMTQPRHIDRAIAQIGQLPVEPWDIAKNDH
ncbi:hypothetical protein [Methylobacterium sp. WCS2018Hpa-22]|uniref:hypothetical protein n=1 Tax=Methylobacterium sp. WCS2018Hpa-22 TaxID=3073633 RepID=UPI0028892DAE|nr:hypothetical protein [Methylobacterium sp. WCS2018Hpa-22]